MAMPSPVRAVISPRRTAAAFTLVELLIVIGIIALLISILLPTLSRARQQANAVACASNVRQLMTAFRMFAHDHGGSLPGNYVDRANPVEWKRDWLFGAYATGTAPGTYDKAPQSGTIFPYVGENYKVYRCPSREVMRAGSGGGSNGRFDYAFFQAFAGAKMVNIQNTSTFTFPNGHKEIMRTPIIVEEDPKMSINSTNIEGGHSDDDQIAHTHRSSQGNGSYYASIDGSVAFFVEPLQDDDCDHWMSIPPSGKVQTLNGMNSTWGTWNRL